MLFQLNLPKRNYNQNQLMAVAYESCLQFTSSNGASNLRDFNYEYIFIRKTIECPKMKKKAQRKQISQQSQMNIKVKPQGPITHSLKIFESVVYQKATTYAGFLEFLIFREKFVGNSNFVAALKQRKYSSTLSEQIFHVFIQKRSCPRNLPHSILSALRVLKCHKMP